MEVKAVAEAKGEERQLELRLLLTGTGSETYTWRQKKRDSPKAGFVITKTDGEVVVADKFEYG